MYPVVPTPINPAPIIIDSFVRQIPIFTRFLPYYLFAFLILVLVGVVKLYKYLKLAKAGIFDIDKMSGEEFEERLEILFKNLGYKVERTVHGPTKADYGVDLIVNIDGTNTAVQAKCYDYKNDTVKENAVQAAYAGKNTYNCTEAMVITNSYFTNRAITLATANDVQLWNREMLINVLIKEKSLKTQNNLTS